MPEEEKGEKEEKEQKEEKEHVPPEERKLGFKEREKLRERMRKEKFKDYRQERMRHDAHLREKKIKQKFLGGTRGRRGG